MTKLRMTITVELNDERLEEFGIKPEDIEFKLVDEDVLDGFTVTRRTVRGEDGAAIEADDEFFIQSAEILYY